MTGSARSVWADVDLGALLRNVEEVTRLAGGRHMIGAIKADGYGFGAVEMARALEQSGAYGLWTGNVGEAVAARRAGVEAKIIMFGGYLPDEVADLVRHDLVPTIHDGGGLAAAARVGARRGRAVPVYLKVDCGLGRLGVPVAEARDFARAVNADHRVHLEGVYTHLPFGDRAGREWAVERYAPFRDLLSGLARDGIEPKVTQVWGSAGVLSGLPDVSNAVCVGQLLYGLSPLAADVAPARRFAPVLTALTARLVHVGRHPGPSGPSTSGGYGGGTAGRTGVIAFGIRDGMRRPSGGRPMHALVHGRPVPVVGVSLEHTVLALDDVGEVGVGEEVVLIGESGRHEISLADWASWFGDCSPLDIAVSILGRVDRRYRGAGH
ncbi:alanine racemase [Streptomyces sp. SID8352]|uniref:alanine racemase n=1 Tax=Streptomyces sp. SID8352 TaxID=2690338 RepID=UPI00136ED8D5|nr:alanine racemase [Streptomyces sp. SID8352]